MKAFPAITVHFTPAVVDELREILRQHRVAPRRDDVSTPELLQLALADEHGLERETLKAIARALARSQGELLDHDVIDAVNRFARHAHPAAEDPPGRESPTASQPRGV